MKRKAGTAFACDVCSLKGVPLCFASDAGLAQHKRSAFHIQQHQATLATQRHRSATAAPSLAARANRQPMQAKPPQPQCTLSLWLDYCSSYLNSLLGIPLLLLLTEAHACEQALAQPQESAGPSMRHAEPPPAALHLPDWGQPGQQQEALLQDCDAFQHASQPQGASPALGDDVAGSQYAPADIGP